MPRPQGASDIITMALFHFDCQLALGLGLTLPFVLSGLAGPLLQLRPGQFQFQPIFDLVSNAAFFLFIYILYNVGLWLNPEVMILMPVITGFALE